jgi:hypothetical protein
MWLRVWDKTKEKDGKNTAIYELHTGVKENFPNMHFLKGVIEKLLDNVEYGRFIVQLETDEASPGSIAGKLLRRNR